MVATLSLLRKLLTSRFPGIATDDSDTVTNGEDMNGNVRASNIDNDVVMGNDSDDGGSDSDGPIVVSNDEVQASLARLSQARPTNTPTEYSIQERDGYPLLFAAKLDHEDVLMACARILDEKNDVSLVREAAAYLEEVEAKRPSES